MGLLQSTTPQVSPPPVTPANPDSAFASDTRSYDVYRYFSVDPFRNIDSEVERQIDQISSWAKDGSKDPGETMQKISRLENRLGVPATGETRYAKMYNYLKMANYSLNLEKHKQAQIAKIKEVRQAQIDKIKSQKDKQLKNLEAKKEAELKMVNEQHNKILNPLRKVRGAFERGN
jgi:hypothetical protein